MDIILHIGTDKTGSTAIQDLLSRHRQWFLDHSVYIPSTGFGIDNGHALLLTSLEPGELHALHEELEQAQRDGYSAALLSWEGMSFFKKAQILALSRALPDFPKRVLVYLREQAEIIQSGHLQWVKMNPRAYSVTALAAPDSLLQKATAHLFMRHPARNYYRLLRRWKSCIPGLTFSVGIFDPKQLHNADIASDFLRRLNIDEKPDSTTGKRITNPSIDVEAAIMIQSWRKEGLADREIDGLIDFTQSVINKEGVVSKYFFKEASVTNMRKYFLKSNMQMASAFLQSNENPFPKPRECWRTEDFHEIRNRATVMSEKIRELNTTPTLAGFAHGGELWTSVSLSSGWSKPETWGAWSVRDESIIRFRLFGQRILGGVNNVRITLKGHYHGENNCTAVSINGIDFGDLDLRSKNTEMVVPLHALGPHEAIEITLRHHAPISPFALEGKKDDRPLALALTAVGYTLLTGEA